MIISYFKIINTYFAFAILIVLGHLSDQLSKIFHRKKYIKYFKQGQLYPLFTTFESFYVRRLYRKICDCWNRPINTAPKKDINVLERYSTDCNNTFKNTGNTIYALNFASYNYLGFADHNSFKSYEYFDELIDTNQDVVCSLPQYYYESDHIKKLELALQNFLGKESCILFQMGYGTNTLNLPLFVDNSLVFSDEKNHMSLINGLKFTKGTVVVYKHNNFKDLERKLKFHLAQGKPTTHRSWNKVFVVLEGLFSMEGTIPDLQKLIDLKKKYGFYIYLDEAHSFGCIGKTGRGVCELQNINTNEIDIIMGTFTKAFNGYGGFIAGSKQIIEFLRKESPFYRFGDSISPIVVRQVYINLMRLRENPQIVGDLKEKVKFMRKMLKARKFIVLGNDNSPIIPLLICNPGKIAEFSRLCLSRGLAMVVVGYPATPILEARTRICVSAAHTYEDIKKAVNIINIVGSLLGIKK
ncbi:LCB2b [Ecytonucleospora hepatopenaei]|uniref:LCB2b n=1 Tax=Ecytonucleospora hepatopenaei TaxID=646526 RepID=A0A1W0E4P7_9MICR|nr:LCB2b [Ecytonucleospora hepatopenaei]